MPDGSPSKAARPTMLCVCSKASDALLERLLAHFNATVVHDARIACRKASLGSYDVYLAYDPRSMKAALSLWEGMRAFDRNTPFAMVCGSDVPADAASRMKIGFDAVVQYPCTAGELIDRIRDLLAVADRRSLQARAEEARVIAADLGTRLSALEDRLSLSRQSLARAQEHVMRAYALRAFAACGGTRSNFDRYWPDTFEEMLRGSYPGASATHR